MVKVISQVPHKNVVREAICANCGATLEYVPNDVKEENGHDYSGGPDGCEYIVCPNCHKRHVLDSW